MYLIEHSVSDLVSSLYNKILSQIGYYTIISFHNKNFILVCKISDPILLNMLGSSNQLIKRFKLITLM